MNYRRLAACAALLLGLSLFVGCSGGETTGQPQTHPQSKTEEVKTKDGGTEIRTSE